MRGQVKTDGECRKFGRVWKIYQLKFYLINVQIIFNKNQHQKQHFSELNREQIQ